MLRLILLAVGLLTFSGLIWHVGPARIVEAGTSLGPIAVLATLLPSLLMYAVEAYGWRLTLGPHAHRLSFGRLFAIRTAGEVVNMTTPTAYVGGEPLKAYLLKRHAVPIVEAMADATNVRSSASFSGGRGAGTGAEVVRSRRERRRFTALTA